MTEEVEKPELKECQLCHQILPKDQFYKRKAEILIQIEKQKIPSS
jgi:hypothetical protein